MLEAEEKLLAQVLDLFAQTFDRRAVLRGGMLLRVLGSPRFTNDLDYVFVPYARRTIVDEVRLSSRIIAFTELQVSAFVVQTFRRICR
jgi:hypothetical protein